MRKKIKSIFIFILLLLISITIVGSIFYDKEYVKQDFDVIIFSALHGIEHTAPDVVNNIIYACLPQVIALLLFLLVFFIKNTKYKICLGIIIRKKIASFQIFPVKITSNHRIIFIILLFIILGLTVNKCFGISEFIKNKTQFSNIFENYYVDARDVKIEFPEQKRNLVVILIESLENTILTEKNGGEWNYEMVPELEKIANENTNFSNTGGIGGSIQIYGTEYSAAGNVALTAGIPLKTADLLKDTSNYQGNGKYLSGAYSLGEILRDNGYNLEIIMGSDSNFGGRRQYYKTNGDYKIFDLNYALQNGKMQESEKVWWGFDDDTLFDWSKEEITTLASENKPFNFIILTADTHFVDGYLSDQAERKFEGRYENVHAYTSKQIYEFLEWLKSQDFYQNTTIVLLGDHLGMQEAFYLSQIDDNKYVRTLYNAIINPAVEPKNNKNRIFTPLDFYPTMLASIGVQIEGERIGLGTNLYSERSTLAEEIGINELNKELRKNSEFYNKNIMGDDYYLFKLQAMN